MMSRGDRREAIDRDDPDWENFLHIQGEACTKTGWQVHAWGLLGNHFHLVIEAPQAKLAGRMKWRPGPCTGRGHRRPGLAGQLFGGRPLGASLLERRERSL